MNDTQLIENLNMSTGDEDFRANGYLIRWTGWKSHAETYHLIGQYVAINPLGGAHAYASYPGGESLYQFGQVFDVAVRADQPIIIAGSPALEAIRARKSARERIVALCKNHPAKAKQGNHD